MRFLNEQTLNFLERVEGFQLNYSCKVNASISSTLAARLGPGEMGKEEEEEGKEKGGMGPSRGIYHFTPVVWKGASVDIQEEEGGREKEKEESLILPSTVTGQLGWGGKTLCCRTEVQKVVREAYCTTRVALLPSPTRNGKNKYCAKRGNLISVPNLIRRRRTAHGSGSRQSSPTESETKKATYVHQ